MLRNDLLSSKERGRFVTFLTDYFAFAYHLAFLFIFLKLKVMPMFYFNIGSVSVFLAMAIILPKSHNYLTMYLAGCIEVIAHQLLATILLGSHTSFHFFMLIMALLPYLILGGRFKLEFFLSLPPFILFTLIEIAGSLFTPKYFINSYAAFAIRIANISLSIIVIIFMILIFAYVVHQVESNLESEVHEQAETLQVQNNKLITIQKNTIISLSNLVENRDADTGEHVRRTSEYVRMTAAAAQKKGLYSDILTNDYIDLLVRAAPMHDVGKIVVSDAILKKPGKLTAEEFEQMKKHTTEGGRIVHEIIGAQEDERYATLAEEIATYHHEKWDGSGYPANLKGTAIPLSARIMALADVFDALVSPRCYKEPFPIDKAFQIIEESAGSHFDPELTTVFLDSKSEIMEILGRA